MAPKKDAKGKDAKGKDAKDAKDAKGAKEAGPSVFDKPAVKNIAKMVCVVLTITSVALTFVCDEAYHKSKEVPLAMAKVRETMIKNDASLADKSDDEILTTAATMSQHVIDRRIDISLLKSTIETYRNQIKQGLRIFNRTFWYFTTQGSYDEIKMECKEKGFKMMKVVSPDLQMFLETQVERHQSGMWVPMIKKFQTATAYYWTWDDDGSKVTTATYFTSGEPTNRLYEYCSAIQFPCLTPNQCWIDDFCKSNYVGYCLGEEVEKKWLKD